MNGNLSRQQKTVLIRALVEWADENNAIDATVAEIAARLSERLGRDVSSMTTRTYLKDAGFTWKHTNPVPPRPGKTDRIAQLAEIVERLMHNLDGLGTDAKMLEDIHKIAIKRALRNGEES
jgi:Winged helix-turn helix